MPVKGKQGTTPTELQIALDNRAFEIQLFWQRSNYFLVLITALGIGVFSIKEPEFAVLISLAATVSSYYWFKTNLGSRFWQESWEAEVVHLSEEFNIRSFERSQKDITKQVEAGLSSSTISGGKIFRKWVNKKILEKPSVSYFMIKLSLLSTLLWALVSFIFLYNLRVEIINIFLEIASFITEIFSFMPNGLPII